MIEFNICYFSIWYCGILFFNICYFNFWYCGIWYLVYGNAAFKSLSVVRIRQSNHYRYSEFGHQIIIGAQNSVYKSLSVLRIRYSNHYWCSEFGIQIIIGIQNSVFKSFSVIGILERLVYLYFYFKHWRPKTKLIDYHFMYQALIDSGI